MGRLTSQVLVGATEALTEREMALLLCDGRGDRMREQVFVASFLRRRVDAILVIGHGIYGRESIRNGLPVPVIYTLAWSHDERDTSFIPDGGGGARASYLLATGRARLAFISGPPDEATQTRLAATQEILGEHNLTLVHKPLIGQWSEGWGASPHANWCRGRLLRRRAVRERLRSPAESWNLCERREYSSPTTSAPSASTTGTP